MNLRVWIAFLCVIVTSLEVSARRGRYRTRPVPPANQSRRLGRGHGRHVPEQDGVNDDNTRGEWRPAGGWSKHAERRRTQVSSSSRAVYVDLNDLLNMVVGRGRLNYQRVTTPAPRENQITPPYSGEWIRLRALRGYMNAGLVEVYRAGRWGLVCDDAWDIKDANVACRQLGFKQGATSAPGEAHYGLPQGRWEDKDIVMDDVECSGDEASLQHCDYSAQHDCRVHEAASVVCKPNTGCPDGWVAGPDGCYQFVGGAGNYKAAAAKCESMNASLVSIETAAENHFLSNLITLTTVDTDHMWYTAARNTKNQWKWYRNVFRVPKVRRGGPGGKKSGQGKKDKDKGNRKDRVRSRAARSPKRKLSMRTQRAAVEFTNWFPGWMPSAFGREPTAKKGHTCVVLTDLYELPNGTNASADYYFWKAVRCRQQRTTISFICELKAQPQPEECYNGIGENYRGFMAHSSTGSPCVKWSQSGVNDRTHPGKGLGDHNFCRNPDNDQRPWCWVARGKFGFCPIPRCSATTPSPATTTTLAPDTPDCPDDEFFCTEEKLCIPERYRCDGEDDCDTGEDELDCEYRSANFEVYENKEPQQQLANLTYANVPLETCATLCLENTYFFCMSFLYAADERECQLLDSRDDQPVHLIPSDRYSYYVLRSEAVNCTGKFRCNNGRCVDPKNECNEHDDCGDMSDEMRCGTNPSPMAVRLAGGEEHSGRVEVHYLGEWGMVCDDQWDIQDAYVVCRMLGYPGAVRASGLAEFGIGEGQILLDEVQCQGNETSLQDCPALPWKQHNCQSFEAASVECQTSKTCKETQFKCAGVTEALSVCVEADKVCDGVPTCSDGSDEAKCELRVELVNGTSRDEGRVEVIRNGLRGTICDDEWGQEEADVICRMLGYRYGGEPLTAAAFGKGEGVIWLDEVTCGGSETTLAACSHPGWTVNDCSHLEDAGVRCHKTLPRTTTSTMATTTTVPETVRVYLVGGSSPNEGRVELEVGGYRGTICDDSWDNKDATVVCKMAGYKDGGRAVLEAEYGPGKLASPILLDEVDCQGDETNIMQCNHLGFGNHNCWHSEDAGVFCFVPDTAGGGGQTPEGGPAPSAGPPTSLLDDAPCGLRPAERNRRKRQAVSAEPDFGFPDNGTLPPVEVEEPRFQKIVGGDMARHGEYPWQVGIQKIYNIYPNGDKLVGHWCGGTIINRYWILSAAHCFKTLAKSLVLLRVGDHGQKEKDMGEQQFEVEELIMHAGYDRESHDNDIALLKVKSADGQGIKFNDYAQPACLPAPYTIYASGLSCHISGWGETGSGYPNILRAAKVPLQSLTTCNYLYKGGLTRRMLCAGYLQGGIDTCQGDSGGPLACELNGVYTLFGVTSWGFGCGKPNAPGVYARVTEFLSWIEDTIRHYS